MRKKPSLEMYLTHLSLTNYRSFSRLDIDVPRRILLLVGGNAQGKTSLLEGVYFLSAFSSFYTQSDRQLINFLVKDEELAVARMVADFTKKDGNHRLEVRLIIETNGTSQPRFRKEILIDGVRVSVFDALGNFNAVLFTPQMMRILESGPDERRRYLNMTIAQAVPGYSRTLSEYNRVLTQRNALLKMLNERGGSVSQLDYWDDLLSAKGADLIHARISSLFELEQRAKRIHIDLSDSKEVLRFVYQPAFDPRLQPEGQLTLPIDTPLERNGISAEQIRQAFQERLVQLRKEEINRKQTTIGPHRDELRMLSNGIDLGYFGSRGQVRTALLAMKLAEVGWLQEKAGEMPVLLLDEVLAELDIQRRADLMSFLEKGEQAILTTTDIQLFSGDFLQTSSIWEVEQGRVTLK